MTPVPSGTRSLKLASRGAVFVLLLGLLVACFGAERAVVSQAFTGARLSGIPSFRYAVDETSPSFAFAPASSSRSRAYEAARDRDARDAEARRLTTEPDQKAHLAPRSSVQGPVARQRDLQRWDGRPVWVRWGAGALSLTQNAGAAALLCQSASGDRIADLRERTLESAEPRGANLARGPPAGPALSMSA